MMTDNSMCVAAPVLRVLSPPQNMFSSTHFFFEYTHKWLVGGHAKKLKNSNCIWRHALVATHASVYTKQNGVYIGSIHYIIRKR